MSPHADSRSPDTEDPETQALQAKARLKGVHNDSQYAWIIPPSVQHVDTPNHVGHRDRLDLLLNCPLNPQD
jgi:hypothetical protein